MMLRTNNSLQRNADRFRRPRLVVARLVALTLVLPTLTAGTPAVLHRPPGMQSLTRSTAKSGLAAGGYASSSSERAAVFACSRPAPLT